MGLKLWLGQCCIEIVEAVLKCPMRIHKKQQSVFSKAEECFEGTKIFKTKHGKEDICVVMLVIK